MSVDKICNQCGGRVIDDTALEELDTMLGISTLVVWRSEPDSEPKLVSKYFCDVGCLLNFYHGVEDGSVDWQ